MRALRPRGVLMDHRGFSLAEALIAVIVFIFIAFGAGSLYLSAQRGFAYSSAESYLQRQGTLLQERLTNELKSANSVQVSRCREVDPGTMATNKSIIYSIYYPGRTTNQTEYWCIYEYQRASYSPFSQLWRCRLADASADQACQDGVSNVENLFGGPGQAGLSVPSSVGGQRVEVAQTTFCPSGVATAPCNCAGGACIATRSVDIRFELNLYPSSSTTSMLYGPRRFGFSAAYRN